MRIALDSTYSYEPRPTGVSVYSREILLGLALAHPEAEFLHCCRPHRLFRSFRERLPGNCRRRMLREGGGFGRAALFHGLNQRLPGRLRGPAVATFHDLFVLSGDYSSPEFRRRFSQLARDAAARADLLIAVSASTADQLRGLLNVDAGRIRVVHHGVTLRGCGEHAAPRGKTILHVGAIQRRKNIARLVEAFEQAAPGWRLILAGSLGYGAAEILERIEASPRRADIELAGYLSDSRLAELYASAGIFAFPSLEEGFGMPVLEAMAWGVPVLTSNTSALKEVAGDAALLVDPLDTASIADALNRLAEDASLRLSYVEAGRARTRLFSWEAAAQRTWDIYCELLGISAVRPPSRS